MADDADAVPFLYAVPPLLGYRSGPAPTAGVPSATGPISSPGQPLTGSASLLGQPGSLLPGSQEAGEEEDEDMIHLLDDREAKEFPVFDPSITDESAWDAGEDINAYLQKHFNHTIRPEEWDNVMKDFPKPSCPALQVPKLDNDMKKQIKKAGKDPHFGAERSLYNLQKLILDLAGPLTCLWSDLRDTSAEIKPQEIIWLVQRILVLVGSTSHSITQERRKVAWSRVNPTTVSLLPEDEEEDKETTLFGGGFLERASKRMEEERILAKVTGSKPPPPKRQRMGQPQEDLRRFLDQGARAKYGGRNPQRLQPYSNQQYPSRHRPNPKAFKGKGKKHYKN